MTSHTLSDLYENSTKLGIIGFCLNFCNVFPIKSNKKMSDGSLQGLINVEHMTNK